MKRADNDSSGTEKPAPKTLGEMLIEEGLITREQLDNALEIQRRQGGTLSEILVKRGMVRPEQLAMILSIKLNLPLIDLKRHVVQPQALRLIPEEMARRYRLIPLDIINGALHVVMANPEDIRAIEDVKAQARMRVEIALGVPDDIERAINMNYRSVAAIEREISQLAPAQGTETKPVTREEASTPITETLDLLITQAIQDRASDIHIEPQEDRLRVRFRIDGILHDMFSFPLAVHSPLVSRVKILADMDISEQRRPQDGQFSFKTGDREVDIRVATMETLHGERVTLRILDKSLALFTLRELGLQPEILKKYHTLLKSPHGMILVGGPTGSGKTTTLYASINELDRNESNIMTIEDPIEYQFNDINQSQVNPKAGITFATGLRAIMRHDPDIILIGEIRDGDTAATAVQAALTGHLVLSSIHANDAVGVLFRLIDLGVEASAITTTLIGVISQRMVRRICPNCKAPYKPDGEELAFYLQEMKGSAPGFFYGMGCNLCAGTGYRGRTGIFELLVMSEPIRRMLRQSASASEIRTQALAEGMITMKRDGLLKVQEGITTISEVIRGVFSVI
ncbi:MAG: ATPase, T2SS/T4P/T4SS family [Dehalococcoidales bacterium]|nr:ATPase, T2SS/T4P/T4SS family [Dehalococcoidales bacterium]